MGPPRSSGLLSGDGQTPLTNTMHSYTYGYCREDARGDCRRRVYFYIRRGREKRNRTLMGDEAECLTNMLGNKVLDRLMRLTPVFCHNPEEKGFWQEFQQKKFSSFNTERRVKQSPALTSLPSMKFTSERVSRFRDDHIAIIALPLREYESERGAHAVAEFIQKVGIDDVFPFFTLWIRVEREAYLRVERVVCQKIPLKVRGEHPFELVFLTISLKHRFREAE